MRSSVSPSVAFSLPLTTHRSVTDLVSLNIISYTASVFSVAVLHHGLLSTVDPSRHTSILLCLASKIAMITAKETSVHSI